VSDSIIIFNASTIALVCSDVCRNDTWKFPTPPSFWDWLKNAIYEQEVEIRHIPYDLWGYNVGWGAIMWGGGCNVGCGDIMWVVGI
jgi:hypothetical protein